MKILIIFGTRPEAIKLAPVIWQLKKHPQKFRVKICLTGQHREMLQPFLKIFKIRPEYELKVMKPSQDLFHITKQVLVKTAKILKKENPDLVLVQGDTTSALASALASYYLKIKIAHVEAGLRSFDKYNPFPEEINRRAIDILADICFAPTKLAKTNLIKEGINPRTIFVTGNTVVDALVWLTKKYPLKRKKLVRQFKIQEGKKIILITCHRRESFGKDLRQIFLALKKLAQQNPEIEFIYPVHLNPNVRALVKQILTGIENIHLIKPLDYISFLHLMQGCDIILTDSGGIVEEAPSFKKPVLILRKKTERPEALKAGVAKLVGTESSNIVKETQKLLDDQRTYNKMRQGKNPFGDGKASERIVKILLKYSEP